MNNHHRQSNGNGYHNSISVTGYTLYVPLNYNSGMPIEPELLEWIRAEVLRLVGASTEFSPSIGFWTSPTGEVFRDDMLPIQVVVTTGSEEEDWFTRLAGELTIKLEQQSIFLIAQSVRVIESTPSMSANSNGKGEHNEQGI